MKRVWRVAGRVLTVCVILWLCRSLYIYRVWQITAVWCPGVREPWFLPCLHPDAWATTSHGAFADMAMVRVPLWRRWLYQEQRFRVWSVAEGDGGHLAIPLVPRRPPSCMNQQESRLNPRLTAFEDWGVCYGVASRFDTASTRKGTAFDWTGPKGGMEALDTDRERLYIAAYRVR